MLNNNTTIAICNYNTTELTNACILSIKKNVKSISYKIVILDNSDKEKFLLTKKDDNIKVIDNTQGQFINFKSIINQFGKAFDETYGSLKHAYSIQFLINICKTQYLILLDSDVIVKKDFDFSCYNDCISVFDIGQRKTYKARALPFIQLFNIELIKKHKLKYFDPNRIRGGLSSKNSAPYDTGASFYEDILKLKLKYKKIDFTDYIFHLRSASFLNAHKTAFISRYKQFLYDTAEIDPILDYKVIVSLTSWNKRLEDGSLVATIQSILRQKFNGKIKIVLTLTTEDFNNTSNVVKEFISKNSIEILVVDEDLKPHKKYFYAMMKWKQIPIITIDDDVIYDDDLVQSLYDSYKEFPNCVSARRVHRMTYSSNNKLLPYRQWIYEDKSIYKTPSKQLFATGCGGILYPENCLNISTNDLTQIKLALNADDIFLKKKEQVLDILVVHAKGKRDIPYIQQKSSNASYALCFMNNTRYRCDNDMYIKILDLK